MKKDGTRYLAKIERIDGSIVYEIVMWRTPCGVSDPYLRPAWTNQSGIKLKFKRAVEFIELNRAVELLQFSYVTPNDWKPQ